MNQSTISFLLAFVLVGTASANAASRQPEISEDYYRVSKVTITEEVPSAEEILSGYLIPNTAPNTMIGHSVVLDWNTMVMIGEKIYEILKAGKAVVNINRDAVSVVPNGVQSWQELAGWQIPVTKVFTLAIQNRLGGTPISMRLKVSGMWGGSVNGKGQYLANVVVVPTQVYASWGWTLDLWAEHREPVNAGSIDSPIAGLGFDIRYRASTILNEMNGTQDYYLTGDGKITELQ